MTLDFVPPTDTTPAATAVIGWSPRRRTWVTGDVTASVADDLIPVPALDGALELPPPAGAAARESFAEDFGHLVRHEPQCLLRPGSAGDVAAVVGYARRCGVTVAMNGQGGRDGRRESHSLYGQALVDGGIAIDAKGLATIHDIGDGVADVDAGVRWSDLVRAAVATGQTAPVVNDFPYLSVGGTLSIGGMGATSHRYGSQADNVLELRVVTGRGDLVRCSRTENRELFDAVLAGAGQYGLIVRAVVRLVPVASTVRVLKVMYTDRDAYLRDAVAVMRGGLVDDLNGAAVPAEGGGWGYGLILGMYFSAPAEPPDQALVDGLADGATVAERQDVPYLDWLFRLDGLWDTLQDGGHWDQAKPRVTVFVPEEAAGELAGAVLGGLSPGDLGAGGVRLSPINVAAITPPMFVLPSGTGPAFELSIGRFPAPDHPDIDGLLAHNRRVYDRAVELGAKRYLYGAIPGMGPDDWRRHYGDRWPAVEALKARYDPHHVLTPGQRIFADE